MQIANNYSARMRAAIAEASKVTIEEATRFCEQLIQSRSPRTEIREGN